MTGDMVTVEDKRSWGAKDKRRRTGSSKRAYAINQWILTVCALTKTTNSNINSPSGAHSKAEQSFPSILLLFCSSAYCFVFFCSSRAPTQGQIPALLSFHLLTQSCSQHSLCQLLTGRRTCWLQNETVSVMKVKGHVAGWLAGLIKASAVRKVGKKEPPFV